MLLITVAIGLLMQGPQDVDMKAWVDRGFDSSQPDAYTVSGAPELSRKDAVAAAERNAMEDHRERLMDLATAKAEAESPGWLPSFVRERVVRSWTARQIRSVKPKVLDSDVIVRDHGFGHSYQAFLLVEPVDAATVRADRSLSRRVNQAEEAFLVKSGSMLGLWCLLGLGVLWLDRLTRGYMTKRLYTFGTAVALLGPILVVVL